MILDIPVKERPWLVFVKLQVAFEPDCVRDEMPSRISLGIPLLISSAIVRTVAALSVFCCVSECTRLSSLAKIIKYSAFYFFYFSDALYIHFM